MSADDSKRVIQRLIEARVIDSGRLHELGAI